MTPSELFRSVVQAAASQPFVTYYNESSSERAELSAKSLANWVAKTHFLMLDSLGLGVGDTALIALPTDWLSVAVLLGCWSAGATVSADPTSPLAQVAFVVPETAGSITDAADTFSVNPGSLSRSFGPQPPVGTEDFVTAVRPQPDAWAAVRPIGDDATATIDRLGAAEVVAAAQVRAAELDLAGGARLLVPVPTVAQTANGAIPNWIDTLVLPLVLRGSVVYVAGADAETLHRRAGQERATIIA